MNPRRSLSLLLLMAVLLTGCWSRQDLETQGIIMAAGFDWDEEARTYKVTVQVVRPAALGAGQEAGGKVGQSPPFRVFTGSGKTILDAIQELERHNSRRLWWGHNQVVVFGEALARHGLSEPLNWISRSGETRLIYWALLARGEAGEIVSAHATGEKLPAIGLRNVVETGDETTSLTAAVRIAELFALLQSPTAALIGTVGVQQEPSPGATAVEFALDGAGVVTGNTLEGYLTGRETRGVLWLKSRVRRGVVTVACPDDQERFASIQIVTVRARSIPGADRQGKPRFHVAVRAEGTLGDQDCGADFDRPEALEELGGLVETAIQEEAHTALERCRAMKADCFEFGTRLQQDAPRIWSAVKDQWDEVFAEMPVTVEVDVTIRRLGAETKPMRPR